MLGLDALKRRQIEGWLTTLLEREDVENTALVTAVLDEGLSKVAQQFQAHGYPARRRRLALDLAAILRLHAFLQREDQALTQATLAATTERVTAWVKAVEQLQQAITAFDEAGAESLSGALSSLSALEIVLEAVLQQAIGTNGIKGRMLRREIAPVVDVLLAESRYRLLTGNKPNALPLDDIEDTLRWQSTETMAVVADRIGEWTAIDDQAELYARELAAARRAASLTRCHGETEKTMLKAAEILDTAIKRLSKSDANQMVVPTAEEAFLYGLTLLVDGWKPRKMVERGADLGRPMTISTHNRSHVAVLARDIARPLGLIPVVERGDTDMVFGRTAVGAAESFRQRGRAPHLFSGRRLTGIEQREFRPDRYDRISQEQAALLLKQGVPVHQEAVVHRRPLKRGLVLPTL